MSKLTAKARAKLPTRLFGLPERARTKAQRKESGNYPMPDKGHAKSAKSRSRQERKAGRLTQKQFDRINRKADKVLAGKKGPKSKKKGK